MDLLQLSEYMSVSITLVILTVASICDIRTREVPDKVWLIYGPAGLALTVYRTYVDPSQMLFTALSIGFSILLAFGLVFFGVSGGADAKGLICLSLTLPLPPAILSPLLGYVFPFFPIVVVVTGYFCTLSVVVWLLAKNLVLLTRLRSGMFKGLEGEPTWKKALAFITGFPTSVRQLQSTFYLFPMEKVVDDQDGAHRTFQLYSNADVDREPVLTEFINSMRKVGSPDIVWVSPGLPLLVFILIAVIIVLTVGDPVFGGILHLLR
ncbi:MAG: A24 family peptidase C-terminal domain-containing protein [Candidatus Bathyarchaeia archaeon]